MRVEFEPGEIMINYEPTARIISLDSERGSFINIVWEGQAYSIRSGDEHWKEAKEAAKSQDWVGLYYIFHPEEMEEDPLEKMMRERSEKAKKLYDY